MSPWRSRCAHQPHHLCLTFAELSQLAKGGQDQVTLRRLGSGPSSAADSGSTTINPSALLRLSFPLHDVAEESPSACWLPTATGLMGDSTSSSLQDRWLCKGDPSPPEGTQLLSAFVFVPPTTIVTVGRGAPSTCHGHDGLVHFSQNCSGDAAWGSLGCL